MDHANERQQQQNEELIGDGGTGGCGGRVRCGKPHCPTPREKRHEKRRPTIATTLIEDQ